MVVFWAAWTPFTVTLYLWNCESYNDTKEAERLKCAQVFFTLFCFSVQSVFRLVFFFLFFLFHFPKFLVCYFLYFVPLTVGIFFPFQYHCTEQEEKKKPHNICFPLAHKHSDKRMMKNRHIDFDNDGKCFFYPNTIL